MSYFCFAFAVLFLFSAPPSADAFNITKILGEYSDFSGFNDGLTQTGLAGSINSRQTITVLAVSNGGLSGLSGDTLKAVLSLHVVLDYYDPEKLQQLPNKSSTLTTLYQTSGRATGKEGFLNVTKTGNGVVFGSAVPGSSLNSNLVKSVTSQPYNISVLQVSSAIVPPGLGGGSSNNSSSNSTSPTSSPPAKSPPGSPASSPAPKSSPPASPPKGGSPPSKAPAPSDASAPSADSPSNATAPAADTPTGTPASSPAEGPAGDAPAADAPSHKSAAAESRPHGGLVLGIGAVVWCLASSVV